MTIAMSVLVYGEAVRFNRGRVRGEDFDFKYLSGAGGVYPYVSSQCYKKHWREALSTPPSPINRGKSSGGKGENQAYTDGNPIDYADDDLFGYMVAGAENLGDENIAEGEEVDSEVHEIDPKIRAQLLDVGNLKDVSALVARLLKASDEPSRFIVENMKPETRDALEAIGEGQSVPENLQQDIVEALNDRLQDREKPLYSPARFPQTKLKSVQKKTLEDTNSKLEEFIKTNRAILISAFKKELEDKKKRATTRRTAPIRMHALVAFSGIKTAKDWQVFARDLAYTEGKNAVVNPNTVGIYSGWLKTRVIIETQRIGNFSLGPNNEVLEDELKALKEKGKDFEEFTKPNPYVREQKPVRWVRLSPEVRQARLQDAIRALANIGNNKGPSSGALHDGSLRPRAFIAANMNCADSPFDSVWEGTSGLPYLNLQRLKTVLADWDAENEQDSLFASKVLYIGLPMEDPEFESTMENVRSKLEDTGFTLHIGTPRKMLLQLAQEASL